MNNKFQEIYYLYENSGGKTKTHAFANVVMVRLFEFSRILISHKGMLVRGFNVNEIEEIYHLRQHLECLAIEACIKNISERKIEELKAIIYALEHHHQDSSSIEQQVLDNIDGLMVAEANMPILKDFLQTLRERLHRYRTINVSHYSRRISAIQEHKEILKAIVARDIDKARSQVICHIQNSYQQLKKSMDH